MTTALKPERTARSRSVRPGGLTVRSGFSSRRRAVLRRLPATHAPPAADGVRDRPLPLRSDALRPISVTELKTLWWHTLDTATEAVEAGRKAGTLAAEFCALELHQLRDERDWLAKVEWP